ncbi:hypothetical protein [Bacillus sp. SD088]|uniref:hypothetical protein n=1 Tax=Bacillus sp. SD088 TaxID=2782012 RepID=UPI001A95941A|nr:hypothetical protein [Bacillus sp. SD088]MBO0995883.1 hypothetical protein [Bacillus sp. SD088]
MDVKRVRDFQQKQTLSPNLSKRAEGEHQDRQSEELLRVLQRIETKLDVLLMQRPK